MATDHLEKIDRSVTLFPNSFFLLPKLCALGEIRTPNLEFRKLAFFPLNYEGLPLNRGNQGSPSIALRSPLRFRFGDSLRSHPLLVGGTFPLYGGGCRIRTCEGRIYSPRLSKPLLWTTQPTHLSLNRGNQGFPSMALEHFLKEIALAVTPSFLRLHFTLTFSSSQLILAWRGLCDDNSHYFLCSCLFQNSGCFFHCCPCRKNIIH